MKAWLLDSLGGLGQLRFADTPDPVPAAGEAIVRVAFAALNPADRYLSEGQYPARPTFPHILGRDGIGTVEAVGAGVDRFKIGDKVLLLRSDVGVNRNGSFAQRVAVPVESLVAPPAGWKDEQAAAAPLVYLTAHQALSQWGELRPSVVLVTGASGGVGVATVQLAAAAGHTVVALSRDATKRETLKSLGANVTLDPREPKWRAALKDALGDRRVDLAVDNIGGELLNDVISTLGMNGKVSLVGRLAGPVPSFNTATLFFRRIKIGGVAVGTYTAEESQTAWGEIVKTLNRAGAKPLVDSVWPFDKLLDAFAALERGPMGKVLIKVA